MIETPERSYRVAIVGLGAMGVNAADVLVASGWADVVAAIDADADKIGNDLSLFVENAPFGVTVHSSVDHLGDSAVDVAVLTMSSRAAECAPVIEGLVGAGINVVTLCEELGYPWASHEAIAKQLDTAAKAGGASVLATGCNPGFAMDMLPVILSGLTLGVERVLIERSADVSGYGRAAEKMGLGLTPDEFGRRLGEDSIVGHVGFRESIDALVSALGLAVDTVEIDAVAPALVTNKERVGPFATLPAGTVAIVLHRARAVSEGTTIIDLSEHFGYFDPEDPIKLVDRCVIAGVEQTIEVIAPQGYDSKRSTLALLVNSVPAVVSCPPGLQTMLDLPVRSVASKGGSVEGGLASNVSADRSHQQASASVRSGA